MTKEQFTREKLYQATISIARAMLKSGCISPFEFAKIDALMKAKYRPLLGGLSPEKP